MIKFSENVEVKEDKLSWNAGGIPRDERSPTAVQRAGRIYRRSHLCLESALESIITPGM